MQQAVTRVEPEHASAADGNATPSALQDSFVINLISSTTPVALKRPDHAGLKRFNFFVSRRREDGRERFRLHMGYFNTQEEAEKLLDIVREIYPGAWAGLAPGRSLRAAAVAVAVASASAAANDAAPSTVSSVRPAPVTPLAAAAPAAPVITPAAIARSVEKTSPPPAATARARKNAERQATVSSLSSVRAAISTLDEVGTRKAAAARVRRSTAPTPPQPKIPTCMPIAIAPATQSKAAPARPAAPPAPTARSTATQPALSERDVLKLLERSAKAATRGPAVTPPDDKPCYAVQLLWSVRPIDVARVPQLAIFNAYTLYGAQGHRDGQRWYGLRLGFFTDAVSAKQVAHYVRADFATVSVVPVSERERDQAKRTVNSSSAASGAGRAVPLNSQGRAAAAVSLEDFKFIDDAAAAESKPLLPQGGGGRAVPGRSGRGAPGKRVVVRAGRVHARSKAKPMTLEETLEILGANSLEVQSESKDVESVRPAHSADGKGKPSRLSRLFDRLSERLGS